MRNKEIKKYIRHFYKAGSYEKIATTKKYDPLERQVALCEKIAKDLEEDKQKIAVALSELFCMEWACEIKKMKEDEIPFGFPDNGGWFFPTGRTYKNQEGKWFIEFEPEEL